MTADLRDVQDRLHSALNKCSKYEIDIGSFESQLRYLLGAHFQSLTKVGVWDALNLFQMHFQILFFSRKNDGQIFYYICCRNI